MSDSDEEDADFSASEDEWLPEAASGKKGTGGGKAPSSRIQFGTSESESDDSGSDASNEATEQRAKSGRKPVPKLAGKSKTKLSAAERKQLYEKYRPGSSGAVARVAAKESDSSDSGDEHLVNPEQLDLNSEFFTQDEITPVSSVVPQFDCNAGTHLSDSSDDDDGEGHESDPEKAEAAKREANKKLIAKINKDSQSCVSFEGLHEFNKKIEQAKDRLAASKNKEVPADGPGIGVGDLLAMGEHLSEKPSTSKKKAEKTRKKDDSDSDWEAVEEKEDADCPQKDVQITLDVAPKVVQKKRCNEIDIETAIKRVINREKRENQIVLHKVNILMAVGQGNYVNGSLNSTKLLSLALTLIPSQKCYPKDRTNIEYFEQITKYFKQIVDLKDKRFFARYKKVPNLETALRLQMLTKTANCKRDYILIFIILLRAIGVQCRLVVSLLVAPKKVPQSELQPLTQKSEPTEGDKKASKSSNNKLKSTAQASKIPQLDGNDDTTEMAAKRSKLAGSKGKPASNSKSTSNKSNSAAPNPAGSPKEPAPKLQEISMFSPRKTRKQRLEQSTALGSTDPKKPKLTETSPKPSTSSSSGMIRRDYKDKPGAQSERTARQPQKPTATTNSKDVPRIERARVTTEVKKVTSATGPKKVEPLITAARKLSSATTSKSAEQLVTVAKKVSSATTSKADVVSNSKRLNSKTEVKSPKPSNPSISGSPKILKIEYVDANKKLKRRLDRRVLSTDDEGSGAPSKDSKPAPKSGVNLWVEAYAEDEEQWIPLDPLSAKVHCLEHHIRQASSPLVYVLAWNNDGTIKDVSPRYCPSYATTTKKLRIEQDWLDVVLAKFKGKRTARDIEEDRCLNRALLEQPLPKTVAEFKNHPLYALKRHLLKFEAIYPPDAPTLGFIREEPVYARECVHTLHSREIWLKQARTVKLFETAYKVVNARPKYDRASGQMLPAQPLEVFGYWQTQDYEPPTAEDGIVPRNAYGNVELFKPCMLPKKTVHLQLPGLNRICKKLHIDCAQAVTGFDFHGGSSHPVYDGFVVCEEYRDLVVDAWYQEQEEEDKREQERYEKRVYGNWKKLIKGLLIRKRLQNKYNFDNLSG